MVAAGAVVANSTRHWVAKMVRGRDGDTEDVDHSGALVARITTVRAGLETAMTTRMGGAGVSESGLDAVRAEKETPGGGATATNTVAMANVRMEAGLCSCGRAQCQACNWERD